MEAIILVLVVYFLPVNYLSNKNCAVRRGMRKPHRLKARRYAARLIDFNKYLDFLPGGFLLT